MGAIVIEIPPDDETLSDTAERALASGCILMHNGRQIVVVPETAAKTMPGWWRVGVVERRMGVNT